ncbi:XK-related protein 5 [Tachyglossus aculeatus]|uniref:XK-related protein 5 n=1 Tax=Tachyglossus aculeatus TaxID=9261 RepID=UPI0018F7403D|nr:XK-related protein 5 [Tachyglossus aculeatus]
MAGAGSWDRDRRMVAGFPTGAALPLLLLLLAAEQTARLYTVVHYFLIGHPARAWMTLSLFLPGGPVQCLSYFWFRADGVRGCPLMMVHLLQLGIWKRHWDSVRAAVSHERGSSRLGQLWLQEGDLSGLRLLEALLQTGPHLVLQTYVFLGGGLKDAVPGVSALLSWLSLSWALVSYARFTYLLKPGHLAMPWAAFLCQLLWRMGMLATRVTTLVLFTQVYHFWVLLVAGGHWLGMTVWLVAQQSDIITSIWPWRLFNLLAGALYVFCYMNFWDSPSRNRLIMFYTVMLIENGVLLLLATDFPQGASWRSAWIIAAVLSGFVIGCASLIIYYSLLHPKSTEIWQGFRGKSRGASGKGLSFPSAGLSEESLETPAFAERGHATSPRNCSISPWGASVEESRSLPSGKEGLGTHHHWLLVRLALKTGDVSKINAAFGEGDIGNVFLATRGVNQDWDPRLSDSERGFSGLRRNGPVAQGTPGKASEAQDSPETKGERLDASSYLTLPSSQYDNMTIPDARLSDRERPVKERGTQGLAGGFLVSERNQEGGETGRNPPQPSGRSDDAERCGERAGAEKRQESTTFYYTAPTEGSGSLYWGGKPSLGPTTTTLGPKKDSQTGSRADTGTSPVSLSGLSPILGRASVGSRRRSMDLGEGGGCALPTASADASQEGHWTVEGHHLGSVGAWESSENSALETAEEPCFTSTPKSQSSKQGCDWRERLKRENSVLF